MNSKINSNLITNNKSTYLENSSLENLEEESISQAASDMDTNSDSVVSGNSDISLPHVPRTIVDSVTAVLADQKLVTRTQSSTKLKHLSRNCKTTF